MEGAVAAEQPSVRDRKNFSLGVTQGVALHAGSPFIQATTILPTFLFAVSGSHALCGFILTIKRFSQVFPQLWGARYISTMRYKKPVLMGVAGLRSACWAVIAAASLSWGLSHPQRIIGIFFVCLTLFYLTGGIGLIAFNDLTRKVIHQDKWGAFFGWRGFLGGVVAMATALVARWVLSAKEWFPHPIDHSTLFFLAALFLGIQVLFLVPMEEPPTHAAPHREPLTTYLKDLRKILKTQPWFRTLVCAKLFLGGALLATPFYVIYATEVLEQPLVAVGTYTFLVMAAKAAGDLWWGRLSDQIGHRSALILVGVLSLLPHLLAILSGLLHPFLMYGVFLGLGFSYDSKEMLVRNYLLEQSPSDSVPVFSALLNTLAVPIMVFPLLGALVIRLAGYKGLFLSAMVVSTMGIIAAVRLAERREVLI